MQFKIQNPISEGWYADPEARFYEGKYVIYATKSLYPYNEQKNQVCFTSENLTDWELHDDIIDMSDFPWATEAIWAPTIIEKNGKYYYIFASGNIHSSAEKGGLEIAVSDSPTGPFKALLDRPLINEFYNGAQPIDAHLFKDDDGTIYLFWGGWDHCNLGIMNEDMTGLVPFEDGSLCREITPPDYVEGPCMFKKDGKYHFMWSSGCWTDGSYRVNSAMADSPFGPFDNYVNVLSTGDSKIANGPGHNGYIYIPEEELYLCAYHRHSKDIDDGNARFICLDIMRFGEDGKLLPVEMTTDWEYKDGIITVNK
ncbi:MAG: glycoside hydrolase family 43 protein [Clostridia bacterium]|nr:glycoside hydrolase family 43 protein [Clostridia bacterium]